MQTLLRLYVCDLRSFGVVLQENFFQRRISVAVKILKLYLKRNLPSCVCTCFPERVNRADA